jgi:YjbE family integral membrane protein
VLDLIVAVFGIVIIDLVLSGDNAVVIGMAARRLSPENRRKAIVWGGVGAVGLRILFTTIVTLLLSIPLLQAAGGLLLLWIAYKLLKPHDIQAHVSEASSLRDAIRTIILADVVMSLDNILAVGGTAHGGAESRTHQIVLLWFGLALSIPILLFGSALVARLLGRFPVLVYLGAIILVWTAVHMVLEDEFVHDWRAFAWWEILIVAGLAAAVIIFLGIRAQRRATAAALAGPIEDEAAPDLAATHATPLSRNGREPLHDRPGARQPAP